MPGVGLIEDECKAGHYFYLDSIYHDFGTLTNLDWYDILGRAAGCFRI
jgi:hypothetical protein